jgi:ppGpp synthetase/RelA/SpoT-type nucleotidyltranferase
MDNNKEISEKHWLKEQAKKYKVVYERYKKYSDVLQQVLEAVVRKYAPQGIVQVRVKSISSFAEKIQRKKTDHGNPINEFTDLCGGRVITTTPSEVETICKFIEEHFNIDWENSIDVSQRHKPAEFGYRSVHYIVTFRKGIFPTKDVNILIPKEVFPDKKCPMKAEIQVRTLLEHAWAVFAHDRTYKSSFRIPDKWQRELAAVAATLEDADKAFERIQTGLKTYASSYKVYMTEEQIKEEVKNLKFILSYDPRNAELASRIGQLSITIGDWQKAVDVLSPYVDSGHQPALKTLGIAICKKYRNTPNSRDYKQGQKYLESAMALDKNDADAVASLAGTWKGIDDTKAGELYRQAFEIDSSDPYPLENYLTYEIVRKKDASIVSVMKPVIHSSIKRCREQVEVGVNIPWAYYSRGIFYLLLNKAYESLNAYALAIQLSNSGFMTDTSLESLNKLAVVKDDLPGYEWVKKTAPHWSRYKISN